MASDWVTASRLRPDCVPDALATVTADCVPSPPIPTGGDAVTGRARRSQARSQKTKIKDAVRTPRPRITERPRLTTCRRCDRPVLIARVDGFDLEIDPAPLDAEMQTAEVIARRPMVTAFEYDGEMFLQIRIARHASFNKDRPALAVHNCDTVRAPDPQWISRYAPKAKKEASECPF